MFIHLVSGCIFIYLLFRFVLPLPLGRRAKLAAGLLLFFVSQQHVLSRLFFGSLASPELPAPVLMFQGWTFISLVFLLLLVILRDVCLLALRLFHFSKKKLTFPFSPGRRQALIAGLALAPAAYGVREAVAVPNVRHMERTLPGLPGGLDGLTIAQITDLHVSPLLRGKWVRQVVEEVNALSPDLILFTGDTVDGTPSRRAGNVEPLKELRARYGVYGCVGNHEYYGDFRAWMERFPDLGVTILQNSHTVLDINRHKLVIAGLTDIAAARFNLPTPDCAAALAGAPENVPRILLDHRPGNVASNTRTRIDLQLSGHTHGGQILGMHKLVARFNQNYVYGWYEVNDTPMYVSSGAGLWNGFPVRLGVPSEIPFITLRAS